MSKADLFFIIKSSNIKGELSNGSLKCESSDFLLEEPSDMYQYKNIMSKHTALVAKKLKGAIRNKVDEIVVLLGTPWINKKIESSDYHFKKPNVITKKFLDKLSKDSELVAVLVNGYRLKNPLNKTVNNIRSINFNLDLKSDKISWIKQILDDYFPSSKFVFKSSLFETYKGILEKYPDKDDFLLIDIAGEMTELLLVKNDMPILSSNFSYGSNQLIRDVSEQKGIGNVITMSLMKHYDSVIQDPQIDLLIERHRNILMSKIKDTLQGENIPKVVFLIIKDELMKIYKNMIHLDLHNSKVVEVDELEVII